MIKGPQFTYDISEAQTLRCTDKSPPQMSWDFQLLLLFRESADIGPESASTNTCTALLKLTRSYPCNENILDLLPDKRGEVVNSPALYFYRVLFFSWPSILGFSHCLSLIRMRNVNAGAEALCIFSSHFGFLCLITQQPSLKWKPASKKEEKAL